MILVVEEQLEGHIRRTAASAGRTQVARESAFTTSGMARMPPAASASEPREGFVFEQRHLARQAEEHLARLGDRRRLRAEDEHPTGPLLQGLDALADRRRRDAERLGGALEAAVVDDRGQCSQVLGVRLHHKPC